MLSATSKKEVFRRMKDKLKKSIATVVVAASAAIGGQQSDKIIDAYYGPQSYVVVAKPGTVMAMDMIGKVTDHMTHLNAQTVEMLPSKAKALKEVGLEVLEDRTYRLDCACQPPPDSPYPSPTPSPNPTPTPTPPPTGDKIPWGTERVKAVPAQAVVKGRSVLVCVADTGSDQKHPELSGVLVGGKSFVRGNSSWQDDQGHGTHVAGTIAALQNGTGIVGVAAGIAKIYTVKVLSKDGSGQGSWIADGIYECVKAGAKVINMSLGSPAQYGPDPLIQRAVLEAARQGVYVAMANGNDSGPVGYPAALAPQHENLFAVAASNSQNQIARFSSRGPETSVIAPGEGIESLRMGGGFVTWDGTSMATPHVAGVLALCVAKGCQGIKTVDLRIGSSNQGKGLVDALQTVQ